MVYLTRTSHPGGVVAARRLGVKTFVFVGGATSHQAGHASDTMAAMFAALKVPAAKAALGLSKRALTPKDLNVITEVRVDAAEVIMARDITPKPGSMFAGLDLHFERLSELASSCLERELQQNNLEIISTEKGRALRTCKETSFVFSIPPHH